MTQILHEAEFLLKIARHVPIRVNTDKIGNHWEKGERQHGNDSGWAVSNGWIGCRCMAGNCLIRRVDPKERLAQAGYYSILDRYESLYLWDCTGLYRTVRRSVRWCGKAAGLCSHSHSVRYYGIFPAWPMAPPGGKGKDRTADQGHCRAGGLIEPAPCAGTGGRGPRRRWW